MSDRPDDPFAVLGLAPTLDVGAIRTAYFRALREHPPERDPEGFRRVRAAYDAVATREGAARMWLASPPDLAAEASRFADVLEELARARERVARGRREAAVVSAFLVALRQVRIDGA